MELIQTIEYCVMVVPGVSFTRGNKQFISGDLLFLFHSPSSSPSGLVECRGSQLFGCPCWYPDCCGVGLSHAPHVAVGTAAGPAACIYIL